LGPEVYGKIGFSLAIMTFFRLIIEFGFTLSATEAIARNRKDMKEVSRIIMAVNSIKLILFTICLSVVITICLLTPRLKEDIWLHIVTFLALSSVAFLPDSLYRGLERMKILTVRTVFIQLFFLILILFFVRGKDDYLLVPLFTFIGNFVSLVFIYIHSYKVLGLRMEFVNKAYVWDSVKTSSSFFYSRIASTVYNASNMFVIGLLYPVGSAVLGFYSGADKLITTAKSFYTPVADSLYPYMVRNRNFELVKKILAYGMPVIIIGAIFLWMFAEQFIVLLLGKEYREASEIFRALIPILVIAAPTFILGFPTLGPMGLSKHANYSVVVGAVFHATMVLVMLSFNLLGVLLLCYLTVITEIIILAYRIIVILRNKHTIGVRKMG